MKFDVAFALENAAWPALLVDQASTICRVNPAAIKLFGATLEGESPLLSAIWCPENPGTAEQFLAHWQRAPASTVLLKFRGKGGHDLSFLSSICAFAKDGQKYFVLQLFPEPGHEAKSHNGESTLKQKLDCALQLARTVALDMNNALTGVLGHTSLVLSQIEPDHPWRHSLLQTEACAARAAALANDLAAFSRQEKVEREHASNLNAAVQRSVDWAKHKSSEQPVRWSLQLEPQLFAIKADEAKIQQAFNNIFQNALEAIAGHQNGAVTITTRNLELTERTQDRNVQLAAGSYICVECSDNGCGIQEAILPRIFEPFFTTKQGPTHRGLGLALVYGIITNHKGGVAVSSQPGNGTSVRVYLPADNKGTKSKGRATKNLSGKERILIVDDEEIMLTVEETILSAYGYKVQQANSGQKALELLEQQEMGVDLVITDLIMPGMNGVELMEHVRRVSPQTRILCTSGYTRPGQYDQAAPFLQKPFTSQDLLLKVQEVLSAEGEPASG